MISIVLVLAGWVVIHFVYREKLWLQRESIWALQEHNKALKDILEGQTGKWQS